MDLWLCTLSLSNNLLEQRQWFPWKGDTQFTLAAWPPVKRIPFDRLRRRAGVGQIVNLNWSCPFLYVAADTLHFDTGSNLMDTDWALSWTVERSVSQSTLWALRQSIILYIHTYIFRLINADKETSCTRTMLRRWSIPVLISQDIVMKLPAAKLILSCISWWMDWSQTALIEILEAGLYCFIFSLKLNCTAGLTLYEGAAEGVG